MLSLKNVLQINEVQEGIQANLGRYASIDSMTSYIEEAIGVGANSFSIKIKDDTLDFEGALHYDSKKDLYLLEARLFKSTGEMINSYLEIIDENCNIESSLSGVDDVWSVADWVNL